MANKNFELFNEYQKRIVEELLEEYSSKGITLLQELTRIFKFKFKIKNGKII